jgi:hypothetical protein
MKNLINNIENFLTDIYFKETSELHMDFIKITELINETYEKNPRNKNKLMKITMELMEVFSSKDLLKMADHLEYKVLKHIKGLEE